MLDSAYCQGAFSDGAAPFLKAPPPRRDVALPHGAALTWRCHVALPRGVAFTWLQVTAFEATARGNLVKAEAEVDALSLEASKPAPRAVARFPRLEFVQCETTRWRRNLPAHKHDPVPGTTGLS